MKNSPLTTMLLAAATILVLAAVGLSYIYGQRTAELRLLQFQAQQYNNRQQAVNNLVADVVKYSETHPAIEPILEATGITNRTARTETKPSAK